MSTAAPPSDDPRKRTAPIVIASSLCYAWGVILLVLTLEALLPLRSRPRALVGALGFLSIVIILGAAYCLGGFLLRRRGRSGVWFTGILVVLTTALQFVMQLNFHHVDMKLPWLVVNAILLALFVLLIANGARAGERRRGIGA